MKLLPVLLGTITLVTTTLMAQPNGRALVIPTSGLISWWSGDGTTQDRTGRNPGELIGDATYGAGKIQTGFLLDGTEDLVRVPNAASLQLQNFTIEAWVKRSSLDMVSTGELGNGHIFGYGMGGYVLLYQEDGVVVLNKVGDIRASFSPFTVTDLNWHHIAVTKNGSTIYFYLDGVQYRGNDFDPGFAFTTDAAIGGRADNFGNSFMGTIDEVAVYNRPLSISEVQATYRLTAKGILNFIPHGSPRVTPSRRVWMSFY